MDNTDRKIKTFKPMILYNNSSDTSYKIVSQSNSVHQKTLIEEHRIKTRNMLDHNSRLWEGEALLVDQQNTQKKSASSIKIPLEIDRSFSSHQTRDSFPKTIKLTSGPETQLYNHKVFTLDNTSISPSNSSRRRSNIISKPEEDDDDEEEDDEEEYFDEEDENNRNKTTFITEPQFHLTYKPNIVRKRRRGNLPKKVTELLKHWLIIHKNHPYPTEREKQVLANETGLMVSQISNWFINARRRILQPLLESENKQQPMPIDNTSHSTLSLIPTMNGVNVVGGTGNISNITMLENSNNNSNDDYQPYHHHSYNSNSTSSSMDLLLNEPTNDNHQTTEKVSTYANISSNSSHWVRLPVKLPSMNVFERDLDAFNPKK